MDDIPKNIAVFFEVHKITVRGFCGHNSNIKFGILLRRGEKDLITILAGRVGRDMHTLCTAVCKVPVMSFHRSLTTALL
jgi:hypothetical protein